MRDPKRIRKILNLILEYWTCFPDMRLGQIIGNATGMLGASDPFYVEDDALEKVLREQLKDIKLDDIKKL